MKSKPIPRFRFVDENDGAESFAPAVRSPSGQDPASSRGRAPASADDREAKPAAGPSGARIFPLHGWTGVLLLAVCWPLNWVLPGMRTAFLFFPLWLGYILVVDGLVLLRTGESVWHRSRRAFALQFVCSSPIWWLFEWIDSRTHNWEYLGSQTLSQLEYYALCTISFSTVMPAVFETAELARTFGWIERLGAGPRVFASRCLAPSLFLGGVAMLAAALLWPKYFYPFVWTSLALILDPVNLWLGRRNLLQSLQQGNWRPVVSLGLGALICGFFWEMWNFYSWPKWIYHTPGAQFFQVFEMPLLGYLGYIPFALELYGLQNLLWPRAPALRI